MSQKIFISYRRQDAAANALGIGQYLEHEFGRRNVFIDVDMRAGAKFPTVLEQRLAECKVMIVLIGPDWLKSRDGQGDRRLDHPDDWVRLEIAHALRRNITVIPVRVNGAELPARAALPEDIRGLLDHQAVSVTNTGFRHEMSGLVKDIRSIPAPRAGRPLKAVAALAAGLLLVLAALVVVQAFGRLKPFDSIHPFAFLEPTTTTKPTGIWSSSPGEWVLYAYDQNWVGYYFKLGSVKTFGENVTYIARFPFKPLEAGEKSERPLGAYQDDRIVFDCKKSVYATAETTIYNRAGEIISHFKRAEPEAMDMSTGGAVPSGSILSLAQYLTCNEQIRMPLAEQIKRAKLTYLSSIQEADLLYDSPQKISTSPGQFEVLVVAKYFRVHSYPDITNGHPIIGIPGSFNLQAQSAKINCADRTILSTKLEYYDSENNLLFINAIPNTQPTKIDEGKPFTLLLNALCGGLVSHATKASGTYEGMNIATVNASGQGEEKITITVEQTENDLKVSFQTASGGEGKGTGTLKGDEVASMSLQSTAPGCPGSYDVSFKFADGTMSWSFKGQDCGGSKEGHGTAKRVKI